MGTISGTNYISSYRGDEIDAALTAATNAKAVDGVLEGAGDGTFSARNVDASPTMGSDALVESGGVYSAISGKQDALTFDNAPVENSVNPVKSGGIYNSVEELRGLIYDLMPRKSLPSAPIHAFSDGADGIPIKAMSVAVSAVQDTNGYGYPWVAGGGVNLLPFEDVFTEGWTDTLNGITATYSKGIMRVTGTNTSSGWTNIVGKNTQWYSNPIALGAGSYIAAANLTICVAIDGAAISNRTSFTANTSANVVGFYIAVAGGQTVDWSIPMMLVRGTTAPTSYAPYTNSPCPISGWSSASVVDNGINQWDEQWEQGNINSEGQNAPSTTIGRSKNYIRVDASTSYYIKGTGIKPYYYDINKAYLSTTTSKTDTTITTPANAAYMRFTVQGTSYGNNISINYPSTDTAYHAYAGRTVTMSFGESVYGGQLDLVGGKNWNLTVDRAYVALDSSFAGTIDLATNANTQQVLFRAAVTGADTTKLTDVQTNYFEGGTTSTTPYRARVSQRGSVFDVAISFPVGTFTDVNDFKTNWLTGKTLQVVYYIATHRVVEIEADADTVTFYGDNVLYADCGDSTLTYRQDIGLVIGG